MLTLSKYRTVARHFSCWMCATIILMAISAISTTVQAQTLVATVNGDPLTSFDLDQRIKMLKVLKQPAGRDNALESLVSDRLKLQETSKYRIDASDQDINGGIIAEALKLKMQPQALAASFERAGVQQDHYRNHWRAEVALRIYVRALNKHVEASEKEVRAELERQGTKASQDVTYTLRQIVFIIPASASDGERAQRAREAEQFRSRFTDCASGLPFARGLRDVAVKEQIVRSGSALNEGLRELLDKTPKGRVTPPQPDPAGIALVALCDRTEVKDSSTARETIQSRLVSEKMDAEADRIYKDIRARAVIDRR